MQQLFKHSQRINSMAKVSANRPLNTAFYNNALQKLSQPQKSKSSITFTAHPTQIENESQIRQSLWKEVKLYYSNIAKAFPLRYNAEHINSWIGYDMDRHQDERKNIFIFTFLQNIKSQMILNGNANTGVIRQIDDISEALEHSFENNYQIDVTENLHNLQKAIGSDKISVINGQYRISSEDLQSEEGIFKINERLAEIKQIQAIFGIKLISEVIIADCTTPDEILQLKSILRQNQLQEISVTPLIEENLNDKQLEEIVKHADKKVMLAGSDSIQRDTYCGTLLMKMKIQKMIHAINQTREDVDKITFFEGAGSTINRNGCILDSRMGTILQNIPYERTIQGQEALATLRDNGYYNQTMKHLNESKRCTIDDMAKAEAIIEKVYKYVSSRQIIIQKEPYYTANFDKQKIFDFVKVNSHYGSRAKPPKNEKDFQIKDQRAITQSMIHNKMHFQPEMLYWSKLDANVKADIKAKIDNPIIKDFLNQYTALWQNCDLNEASKWINGGKQSELYQEFKDSYNLFKDFITEIQQMPNLPKDLLLNDLNDHGRRLNLEKTVTKDEVEYFTKVTVLGSNPQTRNLLKRTGCGFSSRCINK